MRITAEPLREGAVTEALPFSVLSFPRSDALNHDGILKSQYEVKGSLLERVAGSTR